MHRNGAPNQAGLLAALGAHLELLGALLKKADACASSVPQSSVASLFDRASAYVANDPSAKKLASHAGQKTAIDTNKIRSPRPRAFDGTSSTCSDSELLDAAVSGGEKEVLSVLERRADPNHVFSNFKVGQRRFVEGTALGIAAQRGKLEAVSALLRYGARPDATYSVIVGAEKTKESFPVGFSTVRNENTEMLEMLLDARADLHTMTSSLDATMLWEAAYFGKEAMAQFVLDHGIDINAAATSQDNRRWKFTALHAACYKGELSIVNLLLERAADVEGRNAGGHSPLADAIIKGHGDIVRILIAARGDLFSSEMPVPSAPAVRRGGSGMFGIAMILRGENGITDPRTPIQLLFHEANDHVIAEAAKGLQMAPRPIDTLTFIRFLAAKGNAPIEIMKAIAQPQEVWYWNQKTERAHVQTAMMTPDASFIVAYGPHRLKLKEMFDKKELAPPEVQAFIHDIAPSAKPGSQQQKGVDSRRVRGRLMMCDVPGIFFNPEVLLTMTQCGLPEFFEMQSVQAIVNVHWREVASTATFQIVFQVLYCTVSMCLNILLLQGNQSAWGFPMSLMFATWVCFAFWFVEVSLELCEMIGFYHAKLFIKVYCDVSNVFDWARLCMSGCILLYAIIVKASAKESVLFNCCFGFMMMVRWMRVLYVFRAVKFFGIYLLPILACLSHVVPFCAVLFPFVLGFANMYYAFGRQQSPIDALLIVLRLILLGDQNLLELEGAVSSYSLTEDREELYVAAYEPTEYEYVVRVFMVVCAMVMGTAMMNIFIAVLSEEYSEAHRIRHGMFFRSRAELAIREYITWRGLRQAFNVLTMPAGHGSLDDEHGGNFVWYFTREEDLVDDALASTLENHKAEIINEMQKCHSVMVDEVRKTPSLEVSKPIRAR